MKTIYIECKMGAAGDMLCSALYELLSDGQKQEYTDTMNRIFGEAVSVSPEPMAQCGIYGTHMRVTVLGQEEGLHSHTHGPEEEGYHHHEAGEEGHHHHGPEEEGHHHHGLEEEGHHHHGPEEEGHHHHGPEEEGHHHHGPEEEGHHHHGPEEEGHHHHGPEAHEEGHQAHSHTHAHYSYSGVLHQIEGLDLPEEIRRDAAEIYRLIGEAEAAAHQSTLENIHFHEVGSLDALADVTGASLLFSMIGADRILCSPIHVGNGTVHCAHGILPVPAPATAEILKGIPWYTGQIMSELCTPTGAAILKHFVSAFCDMPVMVIRRQGLGLGTKVFPVCNGVRVFLGETQEKAGSESEDRVTELCCNLDDMTGEALGYAMDRLLAEGALDVWYTDIHMKKNRPAVLLSCLCRADRAEEFVRKILKYTTTRGVRCQEYHRYKLTSVTETEDTSYGPIRRKISSGYGVCRSKYEYEDLKTIADRESLSIPELLDKLR